MVDQNTAVRGNKTAPADGRDPAVRVPKAVRDAAQRSEDIVNANNGAPPITTVEDAPDVPGDDRVVIPPTQAQPNQQIQQPTAPAAPPTGKVYSENDFKSMQARYERSDQQAQRLSEEVSSLRNVIATLHAAPPAPAPAAAATTPPELQAQSFLTPKEIEEYGPEFLDVVGKKAREIAGAEVAQLRQQVENLQRGFQSTSQVNLAQARDTMLAQLDERLPDWRNLNVDQNFIAWLRLPDAFSGAIRQDLLKDAYDQNNAARVAAFFQGFLAEEAAVAPANAPPARPGAAPAQKVSLETFAAPGRAKSAAAQVPVEKPIITRAQVTQFYADVAAGKYRGREAERIENESMIFSAQNEGRLR